jgi:hypothetical protein
MSVIASSSTTWQDANFNNIQLGLVGEDGKYLGDRITGQELQDALTNPLNSKIAEGLKKALATLPRTVTKLPKNYKFSDTGTINRLELNAFGNVQKKAFELSPANEKSINLQTQLKNIVTNENAPSASKTPKPQVVITTYRPDQIADKVNAAFMKSRGTKATASELQSITDELNAEEKKHPSVNTYSVVNGKSVTSVVPGVVEDTFINNRVASYAAKTPAATGKSGIPIGPEGAMFSTLKNFAYNHGLPLTDDTAKQYAKQITDGAMSEELVTNTLRDQAASLYPQLADKIKAGISVKTLADPYIQTMSNILELPVSQIGVDNATIKNALGYTAPDGTLATKSLYQFEQDLRNDPRWKYTSNARESLDSVGRGVLRDMGVAY